MSWVFTAFSLYLLLDDVHLVRHLVVRQLQSSACSVEWVSGIGLTCCMLSASASLKGKDKFPFYFRSTKVWLDGDACLARMGICCDVICHELSIPLVLMVWQLSAIGRAESFCSVLLDPDHFSISVTSSLNNVQYIQQYYRLY